MVPMNTAADNGVNRSNAVFFICPYSHHKVEHLTVMADIKHIIK